VIHTPEILEAHLQLEHSFVSHLYHCQYSQFYKALALIEQDLKADRFFFSHYRFYVREMRVIAYSQLLESYSSVTVDSMAKSFGVTKEFIDLDVSKFIAAGRLHCVIDKVNGVLETNRPNTTNAQYQNCIKQGDLLLNRIQKLSRVIHV
jgi:26S proteasome regulatory subunit N7